MYFNVYEIDNTKKPISEETIDAWRKDKDRILVLASSLNITYLQGIRDCIGLDCILIGSNGMEIQIGRDVPQKIETNSIYDALKWIKRRYKE